MGTNTIRAEFRIMNAARHLVKALAGSARAVEGKTGISGAQLFILRQLASSAEPMSVNDLAELTLTHQSTVSGVVTRLVDSHLVTRRPSADDARRVDIALTARGRALVRNAPPTVQMQLIKGLAHLAPERRAALGDALEEWLDYAGLGKGAPPLFFEADA